MGARPITQGVFGGRLRFGLLHLSFGRKAVVHTARAYRGILPQGWNPTIDAHRSTNSWGFEGLWIRGSLAHGDPLVWLNRVSTNRWTPLP